MLARWREESRLRARYPAEPWLETCQGKVETRLRHAPPAGFVVKLESVRREARGAPKQRRKVEFVLWEDEQTVTETEPGPRGVTVPFRFKIPRL